MNFKKLLSTMIVAVTVVSAQANVHDEDTGNKFRILGQLDLNVSDVKEVTDSGVSFNLGAEGVYFFSPNIGVHAGLVYNNLAAEDPSIDYSATYLDIPFGVTFAWKPSGMPGVTNFFNLGLFFGLPIADFEADTPLGTAEFETESVLGFNLESYTLFPIDPGLSLGLHVGVKFSFGDITDAQTVAGFGALPASGKYTQISIGLGAKFL